MGPQHLHMYEKLAEEHRQELLHEAEQRRLMAHLPSRSGLGRHVIARLGAFLVTVGMWLERVERPELDFTSGKATRSLSRTLQ